MVEYAKPFSMDCRERGSHARGVYTTQDTLRMGTAKMKQEEGEDTRIIVSEGDADTRIIVKGEEADTRIIAKK